MIIILIQVILKVTVISVEHYCKVNPACFICLKMINSWKHKKFRKVIKCNQLHYFNKVIEIVTLLVICNLLHFQSNLPSTVYQTLRWLPVWQEMCVCVVLFQESRLYPVPLEMYWRIYLLRRRKHRETLWIKSLVSDSLMIIDQWSASVSSLVWSASLVLTKTVFIYSKI